MANVGIAHNDAISPFAMFQKLFSTVASKRETLPKKCSFGNLSIIFGRIALAIPIYRYVMSVRPSVCRSTFWLKF